jgi:hypothetical protein
MSRKLQTAVLCGLLAAKDYIFEDPTTMADIYGLDKDMFNNGNEHLTKNECKSLLTMIDSVVAASNLSQRYTILERKDPGWAAGQAALTKWFTKQKVSRTLSNRIDEVWTRLELTPLQLIQDPCYDDFPELRDADSSREDIMLAIFGENALAQKVRGDVRDACSNVMHHSWERHRKRYQRAKKRLAHKRIEAASFCKSK